MRVSALLVFFALLPAACGPAKSNTTAKAPSAETRAAVGAESPYAGQWAADTRLCSDAAQLWTIEANRMGVRSDMRFCVWGPISSRTENGETLWRAEAACKHQGHDTRDFVFFRLDPDWSQMRVTFNDAKPISLVRCASAAL